LGHDAVKFVPKEKGWLSEEKGREEKRSEECRE